MLSIAERQLGDETRSLEVLERCDQVFPLDADEPQQSTERRTDPYSVLGEVPLAAVPKFTSMRMPSGRGGLSGSVTTPPSVTRHRSKSSA